jgi:leader peptidase (prepilin peptidase) / N-methyltransferase
MPALVAVLTGILGLLVGSFLNVVAYRVPRKESIVEPPSHCPSCATRLTPLDLVPVGSWLALRGRCRHCHSAISARYPAVELLTGVVFALLGVRFSSSWALPAYLLFGAIVVVLSVIDLATLTLPRRIIHVGLLGGAVLLLVGALADGEPRRIWWAAAGAAIAFAFFFLVHLASPRSMGFGDVRLSTLLGLHLGWLGMLHVPIGLFLGFLLGAVVGVAMMAVGRAGRRTALPFGPFLALGTLIAVLVGDPLIDVWLRR